jgi:hypothetical protein
MYLFIVYLCTYVSITYVLKHIPIIGNQLRGNGSLKWKYRYVHSTCRQCLECLNPWNWAFFLELNLFRSIDVWGIFLHKVQKSIWRMSTVFLQAVIVLKYLIEDFLGAILSMPWLTLTCTFSTALKQHRLCQYIQRAIQLGRYYRV